MNAATRPLAIVTGASSGIGLELARECARHGFDLIIGADRPLDVATQELKGLGGAVEAVQADLATPAGVDKLIELAGGRQVDALLANAGHGLGGAFLDQSFADITHLIDTNITGTLALIHKVGKDMRSRHTGRILITGSIAGFMPGTFQAVYNGSKAFLDSFSWALRNELKDSGVSVTCLMPGITDTDFFERAGMMDTKVGADDHKMDPAEVARIGFKAMMDGEGDVVTGLRNKIQSALAAVTPSAVLAEQHRRLAQPGTAKQQ
ncbi:MAG TPA: SDR family NAD(P)-dependent oxidoreductase [Steroidobacteraceae bacterium]|jgi:short-subunit dehydrogenase|nr:SDR family NAD(P)-dependent oxidoreductase [Steroidobacteraceae bacterium]